MNVSGIHGWRKIQLGDVCDFRRGLTYSKSDEVECNGTPVLRANNVDLSSGELDFSEIRYINSQISVPWEKKVQKGCILICTASGSKNHLGKSALIDFDDDYAFGGFMGLLVPQPVVNSKYLKFILRSDLYSKFIDGLSDGTNINNLKFKQLSQFTFPLPPLEVQNRIVTILNEAFKGLDRVRANFEGNLRDSRELYQSILNKFLQESEGKITSLGEVCLIDKQKHDGSPARYVGLENISNGTGNLVVSCEIKSMKSMTYRFDSDHLLYGRLRPYLNKALTPEFEGHCSSEIFPLRPNGNLDRRYLFYWLTSKKIRNLIDATSTGTRMPRANMTEVMDFEIRVPPIAEQRRIVLVLNEALDRIEQVRNNYNNKLIDLNSLKQSLLQQAFSGKLT